MNGSAEPTRWWQLAGPALFCVLLGVFELSYSVGAHGQQLAAPNGWQLIVLLNGCAALLLRRRFPRSVAVLAVAAATALPLIPPHAVIVDPAAVLALYTVAVRTERAVALWIAALAVLALTASVAVALPDHFLDFRVLLPLNYVLGATAVGEAARTRRAYLAQARRRVLDAERDRVLEARRQVREERIRIARDLHDVIAHHITVVNAQAGVARHLLDRDPAAAKCALGGIEDSTRAALHELRATVGLLRSEGESAESREPVPGLDHLSTLLASMREGGLQVQLSTTGVPVRLGTAVDLAAYRIVQEALTNAAKHGISDHADLRLDYTAEALLITVSNPADPAHAGPGTGHGVLGMRERARNSGGSLETGTRADSIYEVRARLPIGETDSTDIAAAAT
ncbi:sensor histidine kinase [Nocardia goodfellowii]